MFIQTYKKVVCSKCGATDCYETVHGNGKVIKRCKKCGHEKVIMTITTTNTTEDGVMYIYNNKDNEEEIF